MGGAELGRESSTTDKEPPRVASIKDVYYFATTTDKVLIGISCTCFILVGVGNASFQLFMGDVLEPQPEDRGKLAPGGERGFKLFCILGGSIACTMGCAVFTALIPRNRQMAKWKVEYLKSVLRQDIGWYDVNQPQELASRMGESIVLIENAHSVGTYQSLMPIGMMLGGIGIAIGKQYDLGLLAVGIAIVTVVPASFVQMKTIANRVNLLADAYAPAAGFSAEILGAIRTVAALGMERFATGKYDASLANAERVAVRTTSKIAISTAAVISFVYYVTGAVSLYVVFLLSTQMKDSEVVLAENGRSYCVRAICDEQYNQFALLEPLNSIPVNGSCPPGREPFIATCSSGEAAADFLRPTDPSVVPFSFLAGGTDYPCGFDFADTFVAINAILNGFMQMAMIPAGIAALTKGKYAASNCLRVIARKPPIDSFDESGLKPASVAGAIEVRDVVFAYPSAPLFTICNGYTLSIPAGSSCALCGPSGSGKSTIVALLERFYDPQGGSIEIDGVDIRTLNLAWLRAQIGLVGQEPVLFEGTVAENIRYGKPDATDAEIEEAARVANAHEFIRANLSEGYGTQVGQAGSKLSGGQKQRVAIARGMVKKPSVLLLDEATSALDNTSEKVVQAALDQITSQSKLTSVIIAHRLSTIRGANQIAVVRKGEVVEKGTFDQLMAIGEGGLFHSLAAKQEENTLSDMSALAGREPTAARKDSPVLGPTPGAASGRSRSVSGESSGKTPGRMSVFAKLKASVSGKNDGKSARSGKEEVVVDAVAVEPSELSSEVVVAEPEKKKLTTQQASNRLMGLFERGDKCLLVIGSFLIAISGAVQGAMGLLVIRTLFTIQRYDPQQLRDEGTGWSIGMIGAGLLNQLCDSTARICFSTAGEHLTRKLRNLAFRKLLHQEIGYFDEDENSVGQLTEFLAEKVLLVQGLANENLMTIIHLFSSLVTCVTIIIIMGDWRIFLIFLGSLPISMVLMVKGMMKAGSLPPQFQKKDAKGQHDEENRTAGSIIGEVVGSIRTVASFNAESHFVERYAKGVEAIRVADNKQAPVACVLIGTGQSSLILVMGAIFWYGFYLIDEGYVTADNEGCSKDFSDLLVKVMLPTFSMMFFMLTMGQNASQATDAVAALEASIQLFDRIDRKSSRDPFSEEGEMPSRLTGAIEARDVVFAYPTRPDFNICRGYNLVITPGQACALVGPSGSGKSTIVALLQRFYDPQEGSVLIDGVDIRTLNLAWLRAQIGMVGQEPVLFEGTVAENIARGKEGATQEDVVEAAKSANAHDFITTALGNGYDTQVGLRGGKLSGGQKQRVAIARALVRKPAVMLLDEATSALDAESEKIVQAALDDLMAKQKRTTIMIAHRLSTIRNADVIACVNKGVVVERGTHDELLGKGGLYAELVQASS